MEWRERLRLVTATATITSLAWVLVGALLYTRQMTPPAATNRARVAPVAPVRPAPTSASAPVQLPSSGRLLLPVAGVTTSQLVDTWNAPRAKGARRHEAIDIMAPRGTPVLAAADGTVEKLFVSKLGGNTIYVRSPDRRTIYYYAHLDHYAPGLAEQQQVRAGQTIGAVGATGDASVEAPHLHFAINVMQPSDGWWQGQAIDPYPLLRP